MYTRAKALMCLTTHFYRLIHQCPVRVPNGQGKVSEICFFFKPGNNVLEELTVLKRSPDLLNNVKIGQDQLQLIMKHFLFYGVAVILVK